MNIGSICQRRLVTLERTNSLAQAATLMRERPVAAVACAGHRHGGLAAVRRPRQPSHLQEVQ